MFGDLCNVATNIDRGVLLCGFFPDKYYLKEKTEYFWIYKKIEELESNKERWNLQYEFSVEGYLLKFEIWDSHQITVKKGIAKKIWEKLVNKHEFYPGD